MSTLAQQAAADLGGWTHDLSPIAFRVVGDFSIRWYGLSYLAGFVAAYFLLRFLSERQATLIPRERALDAILTLVVGVMVGGRLGYVLLYDPSLLGLIDGFPYWGVLALNRGGMASHGGIAGVIVAAWWVSRGFKTESGGRVAASPPTHVMDVCAMIAPVGLFFGRIANFVNGELLGRVVALPGERAPWYGVRYPQELLSDQPLVQTEQQIATLERLAAQHALPGESLPGVGYERWIAAVQRGDEAAKATIEPLLSARHPTQIYQALVEGVVVGMVLWAVAAKPRKPGVIGSWFLIVYAVGRIAMDFVRLPDPGIAQFGGMTRGQAYSALMLAAGVAALAWTSRRAGDRISGGWLKRAA